MDSLRCEYAPAMSHTAGREGDVAAYVVVQTRGVKDPTAMGEYRQKVGATIDRYGGKVRVAGKKCEALEGDWQPALVIIEFDSVERARAWYDSAEYRPLRDIRHRSADVDLVIVEGI